MYDQGTSVPRSEVLMKYDELNLSTPVMEKKSYIKFYNKIIDKIM